MALLGPLCTEKKRFVVFPYWLLEPKAPQDLATASENP